MSVQSKTTNSLKCSYDQQDLLLWTRAAHELSIYHEQEWVGWDTDSEGLLLDVIFDAKYTDADVVKEWMETRCQGKWTGGVIPYVQIGFYRFQKISDAVLFKMECFELLDTGKFL